MTKFYAAKSKSMGFDSWAVWLSTHGGRVRAQVCVVTSGGRREARQIAKLLNGASP